MAVISEQAYAWALANLAVLAIDLALTFFLIFPLASFLISGWRRRAKEIGASLSDGAKVLYLDRFQNKQFDCGEIPKITARMKAAAKKAALVQTAAIVEAREQAASEEFKRIYGAWYGRRFMIMPFLFVLTVALVENYFFAGALQNLVTGKKIATDFYIAPASIAGAYIFVAWDFFSRMQRRNLSRVDILRGALRLTAAMPIGFAFSSLLQESVGPFIAFAVGVFPLETISTLLKQLANKRLGLEFGAGDAQDQVGKLAGVDSSIADRIEDSDITTITQLAWCDPIQLVMRANLQFNYVMDIVSQALAWVYLGKKLEDLRTIGLRGAIEIRIFMQDMKGDHGHAEKRKAMAALPVAVEVAGIGKGGLLYAFEQIAWDPSTGFLDEAR